MSNRLKIDLYCLRRKCSAKNVVSSSIYDFWQYLQRLQRTSTLKKGTSVKNDNLINTGAITEKQCKIRYHVLLSTNRKSHTGFHLVQKSVTWNDFERCNDCRRAPSLQ